MFRWPSPVFMQVDLREVMHSEAFQKHLLQTIFFIVAAAVVLWTFMFLRQLFTRYVLKNLHLDSTTRKRLIILTAIAFVGLASLIMVILFGWDYVFFSDGRFKFSLSLLLSGGLLIIGATILDYVISGYYRRYSSPHDDYNQKVKPPLTNTVPRATPNDMIAGRRMIQSLVLTYFLYYFLNAIALDYTIVEAEIDNRKLVVTLSSLIYVVMIFLLARLVAWFSTTVVLNSYYRANEINIGSRFAINQLFKYVIYLIALFVAVESLGMKMTVVWGAVGALLIGLGLGIQNTLNDFFSGFLLLFERSVEVGDVILIKGEEEPLGQVMKIGLRASKIRTLDNMFVIMPNNELVNHRVVNLSHFDIKARFVVEVGVRYGSDTELVHNLLLQCAAEHKDVLKYPKPQALLDDFSNSSLNFKLYFYTKEHLRTPKIKSEIRMAIDKSFKAQGVEIPFPQMDVWLKSQEQQK